MYVRVEVGPVSEGLDDRHDSGAKALLFSYRRRQELLCRLCRQPRQRAQKLTVVVSTGFSKSDLIAIRPDGNGDVTDTHVAWKVTKGVGNKPSPLMVGDLIYTVSDKAGIASCLDAKTGTGVWQHRIGGGAHSASPLFADGAIYFFGEDGSAVAVEPGRKFQELGRGQVDEGGVMGTPAIAGDSIFLRTESHLYRLKKRL